MRLGADKMKGISIKKIRFMKAFLALLICVTFFSFCTTTICASNIIVRKVSDGGNIRSINHIQTIVRANNQVNIENEESFFGKIVLSSQNKIFGYHLIFAILYLFIILNLYILSQFIEGWLVLASQTRRKLLMIEYIQVKDGKKNSYIHFSFNS